ncbi:MAG: hypothetical protein KY432_11140, partial [Acidobacteria bacterium]|nr:hypothetical protein [Acidobacteriota bacterium]
MIRLVFILLALLLVSINVEAEENISTDSAELAAKISLWIAPLDEAKQVSGTLLVARDGAVLFEHSYGMADYELQVPNEPST